MITFITRIWRKYFPKKGSINWVIKRVHDLQKSPFEIVIKDGKSTIHVPPGKYHEEIQLMNGVFLK